MSFLVYLGGGAVLGALMRWWRPRPGWRQIAAYWLAAGAFFAAPLTTSDLQVPSDIAYQWRPWREMVEAPAVPANGLLSDVPRQILPFRALVRDRLLRFEAPLWASEMGTGQPLLGNAQAAPFSPLGLLALPLPAVRALPVMAALKVFLSLLLTDALLAALGAGRAGACFAAVAFAFSVYSICWALYPLGMAAAWLPGVMLGVVVLRRGGRGGLAGLTACATGMALSGHPETLAHAALAAGAVAAALLLGRTGRAGRDPRDGAPGPAGGADCAGDSGGAGGYGGADCGGDDCAGALSAPGGSGCVAGVARDPGATPPSAAGEALETAPTATGGDSGSAGNARQGRCGVGLARWRFLGGLAAAAAMSAGLAAPALLPFVEALPDTVRAQLIARTSQGVQPLPFTAAALNLVIDPLAQGSPRGGGWTGASNFNELCSGYAGLLALALALAAALTLGGRALAILAAGAVALAAALAVPPFLQLVRMLPLLDHAANGRLRLTWVLAVAVAAGLGLESLVARRSGRWIAGACAAAAALGLACERPPGSPWDRAWWLAAAGGAALTATACWWVATRPRDTARWLPWLATACLALDLGLLNGRMLPVLPARFDLAAPPAVAAMMAEMRVSSRAGAPFRVIAEGDSLHPNIAALYGLWDPRSDDPMQPARATLVIGKVFRERYRIGQPMLLLHRPYPVPLLGYLGVRYMLTRHRAELFPPWEAAWDGQGGKLWRNPDALPLFFMPASWRPARDARDALLTTVANQDFAAAAVAEVGQAGEVGKVEGGGSLGGTGAIGGVPAGAFGGIDRQAGRVQLRQLRANGFDLDAGGATAGLVVSSVTFCRGWRLAIDGRRAEPVRVNAGFLGLLLPAGWHHVTLEYRPAGWIWGLRLCALTIAAAAALAWRTARRPRPRDSAPSQ